MDFVDSITGDWNGSGSSTGNTGAFNNYMNSYNKANPTQTKLDGSAGSGGELGLAGYASAAFKGLEAWNGWQTNAIAKDQLKLSKEKFAAEKATTNADYVNNAMSYNTALQNSQDVGLALGGSVMSADQIAASNAYNDSRKFSENKIV